MPTVAETRVSSGTFLWLCAAATLSAPIKQAA